MKAVRVAKASILLAATGLAFGVSALVFGPSASAKDTKSVTAVYDIGFNGFNIGSFKLWSDLSNKSYSLKADARISVLAGILFEWRGKTTSSGRVYAKRPRPKSYSFGYRTSDKRERINLEFSGNRVRDVAVSPPQKRNSKRVPVKSSHMRNVVDPLSALVMLTNIGSKKNSRQVCTRRLPIFDGKARYDLRLTYKTTKRVTTSHGYRGRAFVCKVKFVPIAGHKPGDDESRYAANNEGIEIWMIPLKEADLFVPYYVYIPTPVGTATLTSANFKVKNGGARGALLQ